jgi:hypothetical protein
MKKIHLPILFLLFSVLEVQVQAADGEAVVIEVKKNIQLSKNEKVFKNFLINGGENLGLKKGSIVDVLRRVPFHDPLKNISIGDIRVKVAELEIIHADGLLSVARQITMENPENRPVLDYEAVMVGDRLDLTSTRAPKKMALLNPPNEAKQLMKEGEQNLQMLVNSKSTRKIASVEPVTSKKQKLAKKSVPQKKK